MEQSLEKLCGLYCLSSECVPYTVYCIPFGSTYTWKCAASPHSSSCTGWLITLLQSLSSVRTTRPGTISTNTGACWLQARTFFHAFVLQLKDFKVLLAHITRITHITRISPFCRNSLRNFLNHSLKSLEEKSTSARREWSVKRRPRNRTEQNSRFCSGKTHDPCKSPERKNGRSLPSIPRIQTPRTSRRGRKRVTRQQRYQVTPWRAGVGRPESLLTSLAVRREKLLCWREAVTLGAIDAFLLPCVGSRPWQRPLCPPGLLSLRYHGARTTTRPQMSSLPRYFIYLLLFYFFFPGGALK